MTTLTAVWTWFLANWAAIVTALVAATPTILNGLTNFPDLATPVGKFLHLVGLLALVTHKDSPGTFKLPLTHSEPPDACEVNKKELAATAGIVTKGYAVLPLLVGLSWLVLICGAAAIFGGCAWVQHAKADVVECSKEELVRLEENVLTDVREILMAGVVGWQAELASIASKVGEDVVGCVVAKLASGWTPPPGAVPSLTPAASRAYQYLNSQHPKTFQL